MWFGVVTGETMDIVKNETDPAERAEGAFRLRRELEGRRGNLGRLNSKFPASYIDPTGYDPESLLID